MFSSRNFMVLGFLSIWGLFLYMVWGNVLISLFDMYYSSFLKHQLLKRLSFFNCIFYFLCYAIIDMFLFSCSVVSPSLRPHGLQHARVPCPSPTPRTCSNSSSLSQWCHPTISSSVVPFPSCPASGSFLMSWLFSSGGQSIAAAASVSVLPMNIQDWFPLGWTGWISLQSKGLSIVFSNATVQKHQFFSTLTCLWSNFHNHTWIMEKP